MRSVQEGPAMVFTCPECGQGMEAPNSAVGKKLLCPSCGFTFVARLPKAIVVGEAREDVSDVSHAEEESQDADILGPASGEAPAPADAAAGGPEAPASAPAAAMGGFRGGRRSRRRATADALARLAAGEPVGEDEEAPHPPMPPGWYLEEPDGLKGPYTSLQISTAMYQGSMPADATLWHSTKRLRVKVRQVRQLVQKIREDRERAEAARAQDAKGPVAEVDEEPQQADQGPGEDELNPTDALSLLAEAARKPPSGQGKADGAG